MTTQEIKLKIHEEDDLYSPFDLDQELLSEEVLTHLERNYLNKHRSIKEQYILHIYSDTPVNEQRVETRIRQYFTQEKENISYSIRKLTTKQICLFAVGLVFLALWFYLCVLSESVDAIKAEVLSITGGLAICEAASIAIMERPELVILKKVYDRILNARIVFHIASE